MHKYSLFSVIGIEIEYMLVNADTLDIVPNSDILLKELANQYVNEFDFSNNTSISNELVLHVIELKNTHPCIIDIPQLKKKFYETILQLQPILDKLNLKLLPSAQHPWMQPENETKVWPHEFQEIYQQFHKIFNCHTHGWANLQSMHLNLPFKDDNEFNKLHNAIRLILPLIPAIAASSPFMENHYSGWLDSRLKTYALNQSKIKEISGEVIPEFIQTKDEYEHLILTPMYNAIAPFDLEKVLQYEWLNSRAAIAKFDVGAIEIRIIDTQECVNADLSIAWVITEIIKHIINKSDDYLQNPIDTKTLKNIFDSSIKNGFATTINNKEYLQQVLNLSPMTLNLKEIWSLLIEQVASNIDGNSQICLEHILKFGNLSERILKIYDKSATLKETYKKLIDCLLTNEQLRA